MPERERVKPIDKYVLILKKMPFLISINRFYFVILKKSSFILKQNRFIDIEK